MNNKLRPAGGHYSAYLQRVSQTYQNKEVRIYTSLILSFLTVAFFAYFAIRPTLITIASLKKEVKDQKEILKKLDDKLLVLSQAQQNLRTIEPLLYLLDEALPKESYLTLFLGQIETLINQNNLTLVSDKTGQVLIKGEEYKQANSSKQTEVKNYPSYTISLVLAGNYEDLTRFLNSLENLRRINVIDDLNFNRESSEAVNLSFKIQTYYYSQDK